MPMHRSHAPSKARSFTTLLFTGTLLTATARADVFEVFHVPTDAPTIQAAIALTLPGDVVVVGDGVWTGDGNRDLVLPPYDIVVRSENGPDHCSIDVEGSPIEPHRAFVVNAGNTRATMIHGFTITGGDTDTGAIADTFNAGGVLVRDSSPTLSNCHFLRNDCSCWGGAVCVSGSGSPFITHCRFENNHSDAEGGAFFSWSSDPTVIENTVFIRNSAGVGGGAIFSFAPLRLDHVTIVENTSANFGGGMYGSDATIRNTIIWGNQAPNASGTSLWNSTVEYSVVQGGHAGTGNLDVDPHFRPNGWQLLRGVSPCIDAGDPSTVVHARARDLDGDPRLDGGRVDIGADEIVSVRFETE